MKRLNGIASMLTMVAMLLFLVGCAASNTASTSSTAKKAKKAKPYDPTGTWEYTVDTPEGSNGGTLVIAGNPGAYTGTLQTDQFGALELNDLDFQGTAMTGNIEVMGNVADIECNFEGDTFTGAVYFGDDSLPMEGKRISK